MHAKRSLIIPSLAAAALAAPAMASAHAKPVADYFKDGKTTIREAKSETRDLLGDKTIRAASFRVPSEVLGRPSTADDPAVRSTSFKLGHCRRVSRATVDCKAIVHAYKTRRPSKHAYRTDRMTLRVTSWKDHTGGSTQVISERFS